MVRIPETGEKRHVIFNQGEEGGLTLSETIEEKRY